MCKCSVVIFFMWKQLFNAHRKKKLKLYLWLQVIVCVESHNKSCCSQLGRELVAMETAASRLHSNTKLIYWTELNTFRGAAPYIKFLFKIRHPFPTHISIRLSQRSPEIWWVFNDFWAHTSTTFTSAFTCL